jgi:hypothetical protein
MSSEFTPITMQTSVAPQDRGYLRQNQLPSQKAGAKTVGLMPNLPSNDEINTMVKSAIEMSKSGVNLDRGSILNILA